MFDFFNLDKISEYLKACEQRVNQEQPDIFDAFFQHFNGDKQNQVRGEDLRLDLAIGFDDAILGCEKEVKIPRLEITDDGEFEQMVKSVKVNIPAGVSYGTKLRLKEQGDVCRYGSKRGDLYIFLLVPSQDNERKLNGIDIESEIKITSSQALTGCEIVVRTTTGMKSIIVPPRTKNGDSFVLRGYGGCQLGVPGKNGDHIIKFICEER
jgi:DnaJ-class molecular chaperone